MQHAFGSQAATHPTLPVVHPTGGQDAITVLGLGTEPDKQGGPVFVSGRPSAGRVGAPVSHDVNVKCSFPNQHGTYVLPSLLRLGVAAAPHAHTCTLCSRHVLDALLVLGLLAMTLDTSYYAATGCPEEEEEDGFLDMESSFEDAMSWGLCQDPSRCHPWGPPALASPSLRLRMPTRTWPWDADNAAQSCPPWAPSSPAHWA